jgi:hypothetical protein
MFLLSILVSLAPSSTAVTPPPQLGDSRVCAGTALLARKAALREARSDFWLAVGKCLNLSDPGARNACLALAQEELDEATELAGDVFRAQLDLCDELGQGPYDPVLDPDDFVSGVTNPFFPLPPGRTMVYEVETEDGLEVITVEVLHETKEILGIECVVVNDVVALEGEVIEDTLDWYAQDVDGNVWYMGEIAMNYEDGELVDLGGSWKAGVDGAKPGILMQGAPAVGMVYRQEWLLGEAEDVGRVFDTGRTVNVPAGVFTGCLETQDFTPLEPDVLEHKLYAPGLGPVLEIDQESGERVELVSVSYE